MGGKISNADSEFRSNTVISQFEENADSIEVSSKAGDYKNFSKELYRTSYKGYLLENLFDSEEATKSGTVQTEQNSDKSNHLTEPIELAKAKYENLKSETKFWNQYHASKDFKYRDPRRGLLQQGCIVIVHDFGFDGITPKYQKNGKDAKLFTPLNKIFSVKDLLMAIPILNDPAPAWSNVRWIGAVL